MYCWFWALAFELIVQHSIVWTNIIYCTIFPIFTTTLMLLMHSETLVSKYLVMWRLGDIVTINSRHMTYVVNYYLWPKCRLNKIIQKDCEKWSMIFISEFMGSRMYKKSASDFTLWAVDDQKNWNVILSIWKVVSRKYITNRSIKK